MQPVSDAGGVVGATNVAALATAAGAAMPVPCMGLGVAAAAVVGVATGGVDVIDMRMTLW